MLRRPLAVHGDLRTVVEDDEDCKPSITTTGMYRSRLSAFTEWHYRNGGGVGIAITEMVVVLGLPNGGGVGIEITEMVVVLGLPHTCVVFVPDRVAADGDASGGDDLQRGRGKPGGESGAFFWRQQRRVVARAELVRPHDELAARGQRLSKGICEAKRENRDFETYATLVSSALRTHRTHMTLNRGAEGRARALPPPPLQGGFLFWVYFLGLPLKGKKTNRKSFVKNHFSGEKQELKVPACGPKKRISQHWTVRALSPAPNASVSPTTGGAERRTALQSLGMSCIINGAASTSNEGCNWSRARPVRRSSQANPAQSVGAAGSVESVTTISQGNAAGSHRTMRFPK